MSDNILKLELLTEQLLDRVPIKSSKPGYTEYDTPHGLAVAFALKYRPNCAVADVRMTQECCFEWHSHNETEILIVFQGVLLVKAQDQEDIELKEGDSIKFVPGTVHSVIAVTDIVKLIAVTIPASKVYPEE